MPRCAIYARFSTDLQSANSAEDQVAACSAHAARQGWEVVDVYSDAAISGASNRRPGMTAMLTNAQAGAFDIVLSEAIDRIARNQADIATIFQRLEFANVAIETLSEGRVNELHIGMKGTMSALFLKDLADKIRRGQRGAAGRGRVPGGLTYGYDVVHQLRADGELDRGLRKINEDQAIVVRRIYDEYNAGRSPKTIAKQLNADGIRSPRGGEWRASTIMGSHDRLIGVLRNPVYAGRYLYNRVHMRRDPETRRRVSRSNPSAERMFVEMPELRIVSESVWQEAQDQIEQRRIGSPSQQNRARYLLSGLVRCGTCNGTMAVVSNGHIGCTRAREAGTCENRAKIRRTELETRVLRGITEQLLEPEAVSHLVRRYHAEIEQANGERSSQVDAIDRRVAAADRAIARLVAAIADGGADFTEIRESLAARKAERQRLLDRRAETQAVPAIALNPRIVDQYRDRVRRLASHVATGGKHDDEVLARLRDLIVAVRVSPTNTADWQIEVLSSLGSVVALATADRSRRRSTRTMEPVAEEGLEPPTRGL